MRKPIIVGNWKMHKTKAETAAFFQEVEPHVCAGADFGIAAPYLALETAAKAAHKLLVAAENCHYEASGAFTGEVSIPMLQEIGIQWCIVGHSERRTLFAESNETVNKKIKALLAAGMKAILCVGESEAEFDAGKTEEILQQEIAGSLADLSTEDVAGLVIAYEPIWAIGTGKSADKEIAQKCCHFIRQTIKNLFGEEASRKVRIQYGGSVKPTNIKEYMAQADIDGALVGGASLKPESFIAMMEAMKEE